MRGVAWVAAAVLLLAGCAAQQDAIGLPTAENTVGVCKNKTTAEEMVGLSDSSPAVACTSPHTLETYATATVAAPVGDLGPDRPGPEILMSQSGTLCPAPPVDAYLGATALDTSYGVTTFVKYPTREEWAGGSRDVRCALGVTPTPGQLPRLSASLRDALRYKDSARLRLCRTDAPELVTCDKPHTSERAGEVPSSLPAARQRQLCAGQAARYAGRPLPREVAARITLTGDVAECWLVRTTGTTVGTARGGLTDRPATAPTATP